MLSEVFNATHYYLDVIQVTVFYDMTVLQFICSTKIDL